MRNKMPLNIPGWVTGMIIGFMLGTLVMWFYVYDNLRVYSKTEPGSEIFSVLTDALSELSYSDPEVYVHAHRWKPGEEFTVTVTSPFGTNDKCTAGAGFIRLAERFSEIKAMSVQPITDSDKKQLKGLLIYRLFPTYEPIEPFEIVVLPDRGKQDGLQALEIMGTVLLK